MLLGTVKQTSSQAYQIHGDGVRGDKLGSVYQPVSPPHLDGLSFGRGSASDAVEVLRGTLHGSELDAQNSQTETERNREKARSV